VTRVVGIVVPFSPLVVLVVFVVLVVGWVTSWLVAVVMAPVAVEGSGRFSGVPTLTTWATACWTGAGSTPAPPAVAIAAVVSAAATAALPAIPTPASLASSPDRSPLTLIGFLHG
jgi:hypothetical protein